MIFHYFFWFYVGKQDCFAHSNHWILHFCNLIFFTPFSKCYFSSYWVHDLTTLLIPQFMFQTLKYNSFIIWYLKLMKLFSYFMGWMHLFLVSPFRIKTLEFLLTIVVFTTRNKFFSIIASISLYGFVSFFFSFEFAYIWNGASLNN